MTAPFENDYFCLFIQAAQPRGTGRASGNPANDQNAFSHG
jgi:hypothetical protein